MSDNPLCDRVALVTGGGRGIGRATALGLAQAGARVAVLARSRHQLAGVVEEIRASGGTAMALVADVSDRPQVEAACELLRRELGAPGVLINNAAVVEPLGPTPTLDPEAIDTALAVNVIAPITLTARLVPDMIAAGWGRIVNVSSGIVAAPAAMPGMTTYAASKAALEAHTLNLAAELRGTGVTANVYRPGTVDTSMQAWIRKQSPDRIGEALQRRFAASHVDGALISAAESARPLVTHLRGNASGEIWTVADAGR